MFILIHSGNSVNINLYGEITSTKMKHSNLLVLVILLFINKHYRKINKGEKIEKKNKRAKVKEK